MFGWGRVAGNNISDTSNISDLFKGVEQPPCGHRVRMTGVARPPWLVGIGADDRPFLMA
jgi:hypothetical protein